MPAKKSAGKPAEEPTPVESEAVEPAADEEPEFANRAERRNSGPHDRFVKRRPS